MTMRLSNPFRRLESILSQDEPLARHTWYGVGGPARYLLRPTTNDQLRECVLTCAEHGIAMYVLGRGANLLVSDQGVDGAVVKPQMMDADIAGDVVTAAAGVDLARLILDTVRVGLAGLETLAGIPATIGGAVRMNAGGKFGDIGSLVESVTVMDASGHAQTLGRSDLIFSYRHSNIAEPLILSASLRLQADDADTIARHYREVWIYKRNSQPLSARSAGCMFKNPPGDRSAGALIDQAGLKAFRVGGAQVSERHANFLIAHHGCTAADILKLMKLVKEQVEDRLGVTLEREVQVW